MRCGTTGSCMDSYIIVLVSRCPWLMPISCHFRDCKALLVTNLTHHHVSGAITNVWTFNTGTWRTGRIAMLISHVGIALCWGAIKCVFTSVLRRADVVCVLVWRLFATSRLNSCCCALRTSSKCWPATVDRSIKSTA